jgi:hypothetical protein
MNNKLQPNKLVLIKIKLLMVINLKLTKEAIKKQVEYYLKLNFYIDELFRQEFTNEVGTLKS